MRRVKQMGSGLLCVVNGLALVLGYLIYVLAWIAQAFLTVVFWTLAGFGIGARLGR